MARVKKKPVSNGWIRTITDEEWSRLLPLFQSYYPEGKRGRPPEDNRNVLSGILHVLSSGCGWRGCPVTYGPWQTIYARYRGMCVSGLWAEIVTLLKLETP